MRKLMLLTLGFGAACVCCAYLMPLSAALPAAAVSLGFAFVILLTGRKFRVLRMCSLLFLGTSMGLSWYAGYHQLYLFSAAALDGTTCQAEMRTSDYSYKTDYGSAVDAVMILDDRAYQVRVYLDGEEELLPGTVLNGTFRFRMTTADSAQGETYHSGKGIFLLAYQREEVTSMQMPPETLRERAACLRREIENILERSFPKDTLPFVKALLLGNTEDLDYPTDTALKISGIRHVVAVSGLHVSILFALLSTLTLRRRFLRFFAGIPVLVLFAAVAGFTPSVSRACLMSGLMLLGNLLDREYDGITSLSFAALVMMLLNPLVVTSVSFQLSVASVAGIFLFEPMIRSWLKAKFTMPKERNWKSRLIRWFVSSVSVSLSAMTLTTPLCAWYFGMVSLVGVVTNLLTLWIISTIFIGIIVVCLLSVLWQGAAAIAAWVISWPVRYVLGTAFLLSKLPLAAVYTRSIYVVFWILLVYVLLVLFLLSRNRKPLMLLYCMTIGLCTALLASWLEPMTADTMIQVLDVGQGQCILLQSEGAVFLVDCGGDTDVKSADIAAAAMLSQGITKLDGLILTHLDADHAGGAEKLLTRMDTDLLILPPDSGDFAPNANAERLIVTEECNLQWRDTQITVFPPDFPGNGNENSLCILFDTEKCDILITGDRSGFGERMLLRLHDIPDVDVLVAGHHGAKNSTCEELLRAVAPEIVCISAGRDNSYGHPAPELLQRLQDYGCTVYRTDQNGTITIRR